MEWSPPLICLLFGIVLTALYGWMALKPRHSGRLLRAFPRSVVPARVLVSISLVWFGLNLWKVDLGGFSPLKNLLFVAVPLAYYLILKYLSDLLAVRGLCTFLLLAGQPVLVAVRWHGTPAHYAVAVLVYLLIVKCMVLVIYPHLWIRGLDWMESRPSRRRFCLSGGFAVALVLIVCGAVSF